MWKGKLMNEKENIDYKIRTMYSEMRKSEKKVADYVLKNELECGRISLENWQRGVM